jgi:hypothetical protein
MDTSSGPGAAGGAEGGTELKPGVKRSETPGDDNHKSRTPERSDGPSKVALIKIDRVCRQELLELIGKGNMPVMFFLFLDIMTDPGHL